MRSTSTTNIHLLPTHFFHLWAGCESHTGASTSVTMAIMFLLLLLHATQSLAGRPTTAEPDRQLYVNDSLKQVSHTLPDVVHPGSVSSSGSERHFWHWLHKQQKQSELRHQKSRRSRRWKEVANGDEDEISHPVMLEKDETTRSHLMLENRSSHDGESHHADEDEHNGIHVASWRWDEIGIYITFTTFIVVAGLAKVGNKSFSQLFKFFAINHLLGTKGF